MDYVVGSIAALISGNVTPNRPKAIKRAFTPMKHQPSPNVTPKSESVTDRSIFLSPTMQKKKAIVKKSPKRIFQNDLDLTNEHDGESSITSPVVDKVKKHLKEELDANSDITQRILSPKSPKNKGTKSLESSSMKKIHNISIENEITEDVPVSNEGTPKKKKKKRSLAFETIENSNQADDSQPSSNLAVEDVSSVGISKKKKKSNVFTVESIECTETSNVVDNVHESNTESNKNKKKGKKNKNKSRDQVQQSDLVPDSSVNKENEGQIKKKKNKKKIATGAELESKIETTCNTEDNCDLIDKNSNESDYINPNAITNQESDSEHESDDNIESENEESNRAVFNTGREETSDEEEEKKSDKKEKKIVKKDTTQENTDTEEEVKRTLFVGNVPFSSKCKKEIKRIFSKYGSIESVRIRTIPVKDARVTPKLAVIKNELHPDRTTVNVYIKYAQPSSVNDALVENNTVLNEHHLRVARSDVTGSEHDPRCSVFVGNLPFALEDEGLRARFEKCGEITSVRIIRDRKTNAGKGFGYVNFASKDGVELALALPEEDLTIKNRILRVKRCTQQTATKSGRQQNQQVTRQNQQSYQGRQNFQGRQQYKQGRQQQDQGRQQYKQGRQQHDQGRQRNNQRMNERGGFQMNRPGNKFGNRFQRNDQDDRGEGASRRIMNKRKPMETGDGPPQKRQKDLNQPTKEKKVRKEFVGMTADKKKFKKGKLSKDQKKKKALSEILSK